MTNKEWLYIMLDRKENGALVKVGISRNTMVSRMHVYKSANPCLQLVATADVRKNFVLEEVEDICFDYIKQNFNGTHKCGEWIFLNDKAEIDAIEQNGFKALGKITNRIKNISMYNTEVCNLWETRKRQKISRKAYFFLNFT